VGHEADVLPRLLASRSRRPGRRHQLDPMAYRPRQARVESGVEEVGDVHRLSRHHRELGLELRHDPKTVDQPARSGCFFSSSGGHARGCAAAAEPAGTGFWPRTWTFTTWSTAFAKTAANASAPIAITTRVTVEAFAGGASALGWAAACWGGGVTW